MAPLIQQGDLVITSSLGAIDVGPGGIILARRYGGAPGELLLHRVVARGAGWRVTKGDANQTSDAGRVADSAVAGRLLAIIPLRLFTALNSVAAAFAGHEHIGVSISSAVGATVTVESVALSGADATGRILPGGSATWRVLLTPCRPTVGSCPLTQQLRIDASGFSPMFEGSVGALARALRITTRCQDTSAVDAVWVDTADIFTADWLATNPETGILATTSSPLRCDIQVAVLGSVPAQGLTLTLPLLWGP
ncbi:MAG: S24/S26 family peptidase [Candidatus Limnocylindrus sp.]